MQVSKIKELRESVKILALEMSEQLPDKRKKEDDGLETEFQKAIVLAHWQAQSYSGEQFVDLYDFCNCLTRRLTKAHQSVIKACDNVKLATKNLVLASDIRGAEFQWSYGVSIYFPWSQVDIAPHYKGLAFVEGEAEIEKAKLKTSLQGRKGPQKGWYNFLLKYTRATQRPARKPSRFTPPYDRGPGSGVRVHSMRNPPTELPLTKEESSRRPR